MDTLEQIAARYQTDKPDHKYYLENYESYFADMRASPVRLLELGIKEGGSLRMWRDYFENGTIVGLDINPSIIDDPTGRIVTYQGPQHDESLLDRLANENAPDGFDVIIDDCSHIGVLARASFWHLFENHLKAGGLYVIEDWGTGYWDTWVDGIAYRSRRKQFSYPLYRLTRIIARLGQSSLAGHLPFAGSILSRLKSLVLRPQFNHHDYGMAGFVKELVDELSMTDITDPRFGNAPFKTSKIREMRMSPSHLFIVKS